MLGTVFASAFAMEMYELGISIRQQNQYLIVWQRIWNTFERNLGHGQQRCTFAGLWTNTRPDTDRLLAPMEGHQAEIPAKGRRWWRVEYDKERVFLARIAYYTTLQSTVLPSSRHLIEQLRIFVLIAIDWSPSSGLPLILCAKWLLSFNTRTFWACWTRLGCFPSTDNKSRTPREIYCMYYS